MCTVAANKAGNWYRGVLEAAKRFMARWHETEATLSRNRHVSATGGPQGNRKGRGNSRRETAVDEGRKEMAGRVAGTRPTSGHLTRLPAPQTAAAALNVVFLLLDFLFCWHSFRSSLFLRKVSLSWGWRACLFSFVGSLCFIFVSYFYVSFVLFLSFVVCLLYCLSHHLQRRVHDSDPMGGHDSDSSVGPGYNAQLPVSQFCDPRVCISRISADTGCAG